MNGTTLQKDVLEEFGLEARFDLAGLTVKVEDRIVTLAGHVSSIAGKKAAVEAVKRVKGVRGIVVDIEVRCPAELIVPDEQIVARATQALRWRWDIPQDDVKVTVENGRMTLSGTVDWQYQRRAIERDLQFTAGVVAVENEIVVRRVSSATDLYHAVTEAMHRIVDADTAHIHVEVDQAGHVILSGKAVDLRSRDTIEDVAWLVAGIKDVTNLVTVQ